MPRVIGWRYRTAQSVLVVRVTTRKALKSAERRQIVAWLKVRAKAQAVSVLEDR